MMTTLTIASSRSPTGGPSPSPRAGVSAVVGTPTRRTPTTCAPPNWPFLWSVDPQRGVVLNVPDKPRTMRRTLKVT